MNAWAPSEKPKLRGLGRMKYDQARQTDMLLLPERVVELNETAAAILRLCDGQRTIAQIVDGLESKYGQSGLREEIVEFLAAAAERGWVDR
ncbi:pyrroloquinoline quinone biosynthesis peptide chaperone PqqD [Paenibacillaceae bacterium WGS1546]|uniref:pyrroloquinoline quinone biosynthesis peptide chaperone PqqD n=1 Tax=Cohnella sp. WGS1546 TaxID=3366810 RepID=UPI00372D05EB